MAIGNESTYVNVLKNTLLRKYESLKMFVMIMDELEEKLNESDSLSSEDFESILERRQMVIREIESLDNGFESIYEKVKEEIRANPSLYKADIIVMQQYIPKITDLGVKVEAMERRTKAKLDRLFSLKRQDVKNFKVGQKTAMNYYKNAYNAYQTGDMRRIDQKK